MTGFRVKQPGLAASVQDSGRFGFLHLGVCRAGAADARLHRLANRLAGNGETGGDSHNGEHTAATLEFRGLGPTLVCGDAPLRVAIAGNVKIERNAVLQPCWSALDLRPGDELKLGAVSGHSYAYLAVGGGIDVPPVYASKSTHVRAGMGGLKGRNLIAGDVINVGGQASAVLADPLLYLPGDEGGKLLAPGPDASPKPSPKSSPKSSVETPAEFPVAFPVVLGPQDDAFDAEELEKFLSSTYRITAQADRMGVRLDGEPLKHRKGPDIVSDGIAYGSVQVPGSGLPIVLLADRQTIGGYTKIATLVSSYLGLFSQLQPKACIRFHAVSPAQAVSLTRRKEAGLQSLFKKIRVQKRIPDANTLTDALMSENLISGMVDAGTGFNK